MSITNCERRRRPRKHNALRPCRGARAGAGPRLCPALVDRHVAIVDPLLIRPLPAETLLSGQRRRLGGRRCVRYRRTRRPVLSRCRKGKADREHGGEQSSVDGIHRNLHHRLFFVQWRAALRAGSHWRRVRSWPSGVTAQCPGRATRQLVPISRSPLRIGNFEHYSFGWRSA